jgi:hypothetical protein
MLDRFASSLMRGVSGDDPEGGARSGIPAGGGEKPLAAGGRDLRIRQCRRRKRAARRRRAKAGLPAEAPAKARSRADKRHGGAPKGERAFRGPSATYALRLTRAATLAPKGATKTRRCACRRSAHPSIRWVKRKLTRARPRAGTRRRGLFDIVRWDDTATVRRRAASVAWAHPSSP